MSNVFEKLDFNEIKKNRLLLRFVFMNVKNFVRAFS